MNKINKMDKRDRMDITNKTYLSWARCSNGKNKVVGCVGQID